MGRIKSTLIKRTAKKLIGEQKFADNFDKNKILLGQTMPSKRIRIILAGYIARLEKSHAKQKQAA